MPQYVLCATALTALLLLSISHYEHSGQAACNRHLHHNIVHNHPHPLQRIKGNTFFSTYLRDIFQHIRLLHWSWEQGGSTSTALGGSACDAGHALLDPTPENLAAFYSVWQQQQQRSNQQQKQNNNISNKTLGPTPENLMTFCSVWQQKQHQQQRSNQQHQQQNSRTPLRKTSRLSIL